MKTLFLYKAYLSFLFFDCLSWVVGYYKWEYLRLESKQLMKIVKQMYSK